MEEGQVSVRVTPESDMSTDDEVKTLMVSVSTPKAKDRVPVDIVIVLDISGSMGMEATIQSAGGTTESHGLTLLDVAKHGVKTCIVSLDERDRVSLVTFNHGADTVFGLTAMTAVGRQEAIEKVDQVYQGGTTDIWAGLRAGLEALNAAYDPSRVCHKHIMLLTDGESNNKETIIPQLQQYKNSEPKTLPGTINTFGFGYNLDSRLLTLMADEGMGAYSFIPDAGFVGTVFVNTMSNLLVTFGTQALLTLEFDEELGAGPSVVEVLGNLPTTTANKQAVLIGSLQYEQSRDVVIKVKGVKASENGYLVANVQYQDMRGQRAAGTVGEAEVAPVASKAVARHRVRSAFVEYVRTAVEKAEQGRSDENLAQAQAVIEQLIAMIAADSPEAEEFKALGEDINGQTREAFSLMEWYWKWGRHYAPSIMFAHKLQQCNNFKDPGVQFYGGDLFKSIQDSADEAFNSLPAPKPSRPPARASFGGGHAAAAPMNMAQYNDRYAG